MTTNPFYNSPSRLSGMTKSELRERIYELETANDHLQQVADDLTAELDAKIDEAKRYYAQLTKCDGARKQTALDCRKYQTMLNEHFYFASPQQPGPY